MTIDLLEMWGAGPAIPWRLAKDGRAAMAYL
jgi:hypothetical protein